MLGSTLTPKASPHTRPSCLGYYSRERSDHTVATSRPGLLTAIFAPHSGCIRAVCPSAIPPAVHLLCPRLTLLCTPGARYRSQPTPTERPPLGGRPSYAQQTLSVCRGSVTGSFVEAELCWRGSDAERLAVTSLLRRWTEISEAAACIAAYTRGAPPSGPLRVPSFRLQAVVHALRMEDALPVVHCRC